VVSVSVNLLPQITKIARCVWSAGPSERAVDDGKLWLLGGILHLRRRCVIAFRETIVASKD